MVYVCVFGGRYIVGQLLRYWTSTSPTPNLSPPDYTLTSEPRLKRRRVSDGANTLILDSADNESALTWLFVESRLLWPDANSIITSQYAGSPLWLDSPSSCYWPRRVSSDLADLYVVSQVFIHTYTLIEDVYRGGVKSA